MLRSNWRYTLAAFGLVVTLGGSATYVYYLDNPKTVEIRSDLDRNPSRIILPASDRIAGALESIADSQNSQENEERARRDLDAQEGMWRWTKWVVWAAIVQLFLSALGIAFVVKSLTQGQKGLAAARRALHHARMANEIARNNARDQLRPYVYFMPEFEEGEHKNRPFVREDKTPFRIKNYGQTPALNLCISIGTDLVKRPIMDHEVPLREGPDSYGDLAPGAVILDYINTAELPVDYIAEIASGKVMMTHMRITYDLPTGGSDSHDINIIMTSENLTTGRFFLIGNYERFRFV